MSIGIGLNRGNVVMDGIAKIYCSHAVDGSHTTPKAYYMGQVFDGKVTIESKSQKNSKGQNRAYDFLFKVEAKLMYTNKTNLILILDYLSTNYLDFIVTMNNGSTFATALLTNKNAGFQWSFDSSKDADGIRYVQIMIDRYLMMSEVDPLVGDPTSIFAYGTADSTISKLESQTPADMIPAGISAYGFAPTGSGIEPIGVYRNAKLQCKLLTLPDYLGRSVGYGIQLHSEVEAMQGSSTEILLANNLAGISVDHSITLLDGTIFKTVDQQGVDWMYNAQKDSQDNTFVKIVADGTITNIVSGAWAALWT
jgi:hypothetical protein